MYINAIGYYRREDCLKNNIKHEMQTREEDIRILPQCDNPFVATPSI